MAMTMVSQWVSGLALSMTVLCGLSCTQSTTPGDATPPSERSEYEAILAQPRQKALESVLVFLPDSRDTRALWTSLADELSEEFNVIPHIMRSDTSETEMANAIATSSPSCLVLVNNPTVRLYQRYQQGLGANRPVLPAVIVMASFLQEVAPQVTAATGIAYEVPLLTSIVNMRTFFDMDIKRVGVVRRKPFARFIATQRQLVAMEGVEIVELVVADDTNATDLRNAVRKLRRKLDVDAIWVLNDNALLDQKLIVSGWMPGLDSGKAVPVIVGVPTLVHPEIHFGTFAMIPDHEALGLQTANMVYDLADADWNLSEAPVKMPLSVKSVVDIQAARNSQRFREESLVQIDEIVE